MPNVGLWVRLEAKTDKAAEVARFLTGAIELANQEEKTLLWCIVQLGPTTFGIFDGFSDDVGRQGHLSGKIAAVIVGNVDEWLVTPPQIEPFDFLVAKLPR